MRQLTILRGVSGSGKSTWADLQALAGWVVVSRDRIRVMLYGPQADFRPPGLDMDEDLVTVMEDAQIVAALKNVYDVIVDDTNTNWRYVRRLAKIGRQHGANVEVKAFRVPLDLCLERNAARAAGGGRNVPEHIIRKQHSDLQGTLDKTLDPIPSELEYERDPSKPDAIMVDIDGTLAQMVNRGPYDESKIIDDEVVEDVAQVVNAFKHAGYSIIVCSGRSDGCMDDTFDWLDMHDIPYDVLFMRKSSDVRADNIVKYELFNENIRDNYNVLCVLDDRQQVVDMWRRIGLTCLQVAPGDF